MGLFAQDPDTLEEKLYLYDNSSENREFLPIVSSGVIVNERLKLLIKIDNTASVTFNASGNPIYMTLDDDASTLTVIFTKASTLDLLSVARHRQNSGERLKSYFRALVRLHG